MTRRPKRHGLRFPCFLAEQYLTAVEPDCKNCALAPLDARHATFRGHAVPYEDPDEKTVRIGHWSPNPVKRISAWDVLSGQAPASEFHNKLVLIGQGSDAARDQWLTPIFRVAQPDGKRARIPGTALHAAAIETLLDGTAIGSTPNWVLWLVNFVVVTGAVYLVVILSLRGGVHLKFSYFARDLLGRAIFVHFRADLVSIFNDDHRDRSGVAARLSLPILQ